MSRLFSRSSQKAFTLLELIVVIVILGVLAGIAIPTFLTSQSKARDAVTSESLAATAHNAAALAALDQAFSDGNFSTAASESNLTALAPGFFAATAASAVAYNSSTGAGYASRPGVNGASGATAFTLSYQISPDKQSAGLAVVAPSGNCLMDVVSLTSNQKPWSYADLGANCNGSVALAGPTQPTPSKVAPGTPTIVTGFTAAVASGTAVNLAWTAPTTGAASYLVSWTGGGSQSVPGTATSVQITGLTPNTSYTFTIVAQNVSNVAGPSASAGPVTTWNAALVSPSGLSASAGSNTVSLSWSAVTNAVSYNVYRGSTFLASSSTPSYTDNTAQNGTTYSYQVSSVDSHGQEGAPSPAVSARPLPPVPGQVTGLTATAGNASVALSWTAQAQASTYNVYKGATIVASVAAPATTYTVTGLQNGTSYSFQVSSVDTFNQEGTPSAAASATPITTASAPQSFAVASLSSSSVNLTWAAPADNGGSTVSGYILTYTVSGSQVAFAPIYPTGTSYTFSASANTTYNFTLAARNGAGTGASATTSATTWNATPAAPTGVTATATGTSVTVSWTAPATPAGGTLSSYSVYQGGTLVGTVSSPTTSFTYTAPANGTTYSYQVTATDGHAQVSPASASASTTTAPLAPTNLTATPSSTSSAANLTWTASAGAASYTVTTSPAPASGATQSTTATSYTVGGLTAGTTYTFTVTSVNPAGSATSTSVTAAPAYSGVVLADGPIGYYRLTDAAASATSHNAAAGVVSGALGNGTYCITTANQTYTAACNPSGFGTGGGALTRDSSSSAFLGGGSYAGGGGYVSLPATPASFATSGFTFEIWAYALDQGSWARLFDFSNGPDSDNIWLSRNGTTLNSNAGGRYGISGQTGFAWNPDTAGANGLTLNTWHHLAMTFTPTGTTATGVTGTMVVYVDGVAAASATGYSYTSIARAYNFIGRSPYTQDAYMRAYLQEAAVYNKALTAQQVQSHYNAR